MVKIQLVVQPPGQVLIYLSLSGWEKETGTRQIRQAVMQAKVSVWQYDRQEGGRLDQVPGNLGLRG